QDVRRTARPRLVSLWLKPGFAFSGRPLISACVPPSPASGCAVEFLFFRGAEGWVHLFEVLAVLCESAPAVGKPQIILPARGVGGQRCKPPALGGPKVAELDGR